MSSSSILFGKQQQHLQQSTTDQTVPTSRSSTQMSFNSNVSANLQANMDDDDDGDDDDEDAKEGEGGANDEGYDAYEDSVFGGKSGGAMSDLDNSVFKNDGSTMDEDTRSIASNATLDDDFDMTVNENTSLPDLLARYGLDYDALFSSKTVRCENGNAEFVQFHSPLIPSLFANVAPVIRFITVHEKCNYFCHYLKIRSLVVHFLQRVS
jgi:hypothetical protein